LPSSTRVGFFFSSGGTVAILCHAVLLYLTPTPFLLRLGVGLHPAGVVPKQYICSVKHYRLGEAKPCNLPLFSVTFVHAALP